MKEAKKAMEIVDRIAEIKDKLEAQKPLYEELDDLIVELSELADIGETLQTQDERFVRVVDNFAEKNTCFRVAGIKRFDVELMTGEEFKKKLAKEAKKIS